MSVKILDDQLEELPDAPVPEDERDEEEKQRDDPQKNAGLATLGDRATEILRPKDPTELQEALKQQMPEARDVMGCVRKLVPLRDIVHVRRLAEDTMNLSETLIIPTVGQEKPMVGVVLAVGKGRLDNAGVFHPCEVEEGDVVLFGRYSGTEHKINGETILVMKESEIQGILR